MKGHWPLLLPATNCRCGSRSRQPATITDRRRIIADSADSNCSLSILSVPPVRCSTGFALAEALRIRGDAEASFSALREANRLALANLAVAKPQGNAIAPAAEKPRTAPLAEPSRLHERLCDFVTSTYTADFMAEFGGNGDQSRLPVFVVGMPRSGSTLVEQILASHPSVFGAGEIAD